MSVKVPLNLVSHPRRVASLYKNALRTLESWIWIRHVYRYNAVLLRQRFEKNKDIKDLRIAKQLVIDGEKELFEHQHWLPRKFPNSPGGVAYEREVVLPDWIVDYWHPSEKARYPHYFARREQRKKEFIEWYNKQYPDVKENSSSGH
ncbi:NADH dehydrogenase [ubiquinone] 1 beta subcomplex subunit 9 [Diprion similis]|uniref:NADH dehydrogenase [ubiquinone] 1 beta subcomplex subunit 9 n=1 Tax=Diprion similis TaxID=362088 RepID=UPI001EF7D87B|nr:NADH dehydrogenase [ubiquinone] 1 beta subcomplex subunit 9 [Diprion similis]